MITFQHLNMLIPKGAPSPPAGAGPCALPVYPSCGAPTPCLSVAFQIFFSKSTTMVYSKGFSSKSGSFENGAKNAKIHGFGPSKWVTTLLTHCNLLFNEIWNPPKTEKKPWSIVRAFHRNLALLKMELNMQKSMALALANGLLHC